VKTANGFGSAVNSLSAIKRMGRNSYIVRDLSEENVPKTGVLADYEWDKPTVVQQQATAA
jgi:hypothetical protein